MRKNTLILLIVLHTNFAFAQKFNKIKTEQDSLSYAFGIVFAKIVKESVFEIKVNHKIFSDAFRASNDSLSDVKMTMEQATTILKSGTATIENSSVKLDSLNYAMAIFMVENFKQEGLKLKSECFLEAFKSYYDEHSGIKMTIEQANLVIEENMIRKQQNFLTKNAKKKSVITTDSGLQYQILIKGTGNSNPTISDTVIIHYTSTFINGRIISSTIESGHSETFKVNHVFQGLEEALQLMKVGSKWKLFIPSSLAYGSRGALGQIDPDRALIFEVELIEIVK